MKTIGMLDASTHGSETTAEFDGCQELELLQELRKLADEVARVNTPSAADWARRMHAMATAVEPTSNEHSSSEVAVASLASAAPDGLTPQDALKDAFVCAGEEVTDRVVRIATIAALNETSALASKTPELQTALSEFARWAEERHQQPLLQALRRAEAELHRIIESPLDLDTKLITVVWTQLLPEFKLLSANQELPAGSPQDFHSANREDRLDELRDETANLLVTGELLKDLAMRLGEHQLPASLADELCRISADLQKQTISLQESVVALRKVSIGPFLAQLSAKVKGQSIPLGRPLDIHLGGECVEIDRALGNDLAEALEQVVRHRITHSKGVVRNLWLDAEMSDTHLVITASDDGPDSNLEGHSATPLSPEIARLKAIVKRHDGKLWLEPSAGIGAFVRIEVPIRQAVLVVEGLVFQEAGHVFALPAENVVEVAEIAVDQWTQLPHSMVTRLGNHTYAAVRLGDLLGLKPSTNRKRQSVAAILVGGPKGEICLLVEQICGQRTLLFDSSESDSPEIMHVAGIAQLGSQSLASMLDVDRLIDSFRG